ncbi:MAG: adenylate/guanylate cyclase domain-containing protein, partial [Candidatus Dormibacteraeota bacterium]|nr:adenylate/guanylate cyclase domain-containing protein [Candidatus Dormibacteraeota bacterium]
MDDSTNAEVTLLFTDIEGSTRLLQRLGDDYPAALEQHHQILEMAVRTCNGRIVDTEGDAIFAAFEQPTQATDAISAALAAQRSLASHPWPAGESIWVRMGVHTGHPVR